MDIKLAFSYVACMFRKLFIQLKQKLHPFRRGIESYFAVGGIHCPVQVFDGPLPNQLAL